LYFYIKVGVEVFGEFVGYEDTFEILTADIYKFPWSNVDNPFDQPQAIELAGNLNPSAGETQLIDPDVCDVYLVTDAHGVLRLNLGPRAWIRKVVPNSDDDEVFVVTRLEPDPARDPDPLPPGEIVNVSAFNFTDTFYGVRQIEAMGGDDDDIVIIAEGVQSPVFLWGNKGKDRLVYEGTGTATLWGDEDDDSLYGGSGVNNLYGGDGNDQLFGGSFRNLLYGGYGDDVLLGGGDRNLMYGEEGKPGGRQRQRCAGRGRGQGPAVRRCGPGYPDRGPGCGSSVRTGRRRYSHRWQDVFRRRRPRLARYLRRVVAHRSGLRPAGQAPALRRRTQRFACARQSVDGSQEDRV
jgi:Ca2+-binding RTX toxin-like protein